MIIEALDLALKTLHAGDLPGAMERMCEDLSRLRLSQMDENWELLVKPSCDAHPLARLILEDPYTRHARDKPRGYAGDAELLDYIYFRQVPPQASELGRQLFEHNTGAVEARALRWRLQHLADAIDHAARLFPHTRVLALGCGHLREAGRSRAVQGGALEALHALDADAANLAVIERDYGHLPCVRPAEASLRRIIKFGVPAGDLHLAYAAGLYDQLPLPVAQTLTERLFDALAPGGKLIVPNFLAGNRARGYMESFMDWQLVVRAPAEIEGLAATIGEPRVESRRHFEDPYGVIGYLELVKRA